MTKQEFANKFWESFIEPISTESRKKHNIIKSKNNFMWNIFAAKLTPCFEGKFANAEFDKANKDGAIEIQYNYFGISDEETQPLSDLHKSANNIDCIPEFYVIGKDFEWCYVVTHELDLCGPYFCYKSHITNNKNT